MFHVTILFLALTLTPAVAMAQQPCTTDARRVVNELYRHMLERQPDAGSAVWIQELQGGRTTVRELVRQIANSEEHTNRFLQRDANESVTYERSVAQLYRHILGRQPDAAGQRIHAQLAQRQGINAAIDRIVDSAEYDQQFGDWGVPGAGGVRYCAPGSWASNRSTPQVVPPNQRRFRPMDTNSDGIVQRNEWRGSARSFDVHDWNNDGVLSGAEVNEASARTGWTVDDMAYDTLDSFEYMDTNNNERIDAREWHGTVAAFNRLDVNNDDVLSRQEMLAYRGTPRSSSAR
jgi:Ca2+-binding EF-hand superfamily protein